MITPRDGLTKVIMEEAEVVGDIGEGVVEDPGKEGEKGEGEGRSLMRGVVVVVVVVIVVVVVVVVVVLRTGRYRREHVCGSRRK